MRKKILIIDDSAFMRRILSDIIESDKRFEVFGVAINGYDALDIIYRNPNKIDAILLDINMPKMNGNEFLIKLKEENIKISVIIVSSIAKNEAKETILALEMGAFDFVAKPECLYEVKSIGFKSKIIDRLATALNIKKDTASDVLVKKTKPEKPIASIDSSAKRLVAIACSTGGPRALNIVIPKLPVNLNASVLVVQHMPEGFTKSLSDRLNDVSNISVKEAKDNETIQKGTVYIAKGGSQLRLLPNGKGGNSLAVTKDAPRYGLLPCADILYESLVVSDFDEIICIVLTGMGADGTEGIKKLSKKKKVFVIAQNEETCVVYGMPKVIKEVGLVDEEIALGDVSDAIIKYVGVY